MTQEDVMSVYNIHICREAHPNPMIETWVYASILKNLNR